MSETENINNNADETLEIIKEILHYNKNAQKFFLLASKVDKGKSEPKPKESIAKKVHLRRGYVAKTKREEKNINNKFFKEYFTIYQSPSDMYKKLRKTEGKNNEDQVYLIKEVLNEMKKTVENVAKNKTFKIEENEKITNIAEHILYFNQLYQSGQGLKILAPKQKLSRLSITLVQLKAANNSEKRKNEIRQLSYSLYRSQILTKQLYKSLYKFDWNYLKMKKIFMSTENSKANEPHRFKLDLTDKLNLKNPNKNMDLANLIIYYTWKNVKSKYNNNTFKTSAPTWNDTFDLPDGSYSILDIQDYFEFINKKQETLTENPPIRIYPNKIKNRVVFKIKAGYKLELLTP